jgi:chorismate mutase
VTDIDHWRCEIDQLNLQLVELLNRRSRCAIEIVKIKQKMNLGIYDPKREDEVIRLVQEATRGPLSKAAIKRLFERIIDESRRVEREYRNRG